MTTAHTRNLVYAFITSPTYIRIVKCSQHKRLTQTTIIRGFTSGSEYLEKSRLSHVGQTIFKKAERVSWCSRGTTVQPIAYIITGMAKNVLFPPPPCLLFRRMSRWMHSFGCETTSVASSFWLFLHYLAFCVCVSMSWVALTLQHQWGYSLCDQMSISVCPVASSSFVVASILARDRFTKIMSQRMMLTPPYCYNYFKKRFTLFSRKYYDLEKCYTITDLILSRIKQYAMPWGVHRRVMNTHMICELK